MECGANENFIWKGKGNNAMLGNMWESIRTWRNKDMMARGIWASPIRKTSNFLWWLNSDASQWWIEYYHVECKLLLLCPYVKEKMKLWTICFFTCSYCTRVMNEWLIFLHDAFWMLENVVEKMELIIENSKLWGLHWTLLVWGVKK